MPVGYYYSSSGQKLPWPVSPHSHADAYLPLSGGTLSGVLNFSSSTSSLGLSAGDSASTYATRWPLTIGYLDNPGFFRHGIGARHHGGAGATAAGNALDFYLWNNTRTMGELPTASEVVFTIENDGIKAFRGMDVQDVNDTAFRLFVNAGNPSIQPGDGAGGYMANRELYYNVTDDQWTVKGDLTLDTTNDITALWMKSEAGKRSRITLAGASARWFIEKDNSPETGANAGSNFVVGRRSDDGAFIDNPIEISRATGVVDFEHTPTVDGVAISTSSHTHAATDVTSGTLAIARTPVSAIFNNQGLPHSTYGDFNNVPDYGPYHVVSSLNGPGTGSAQFYTMSLGLGSQFSYSQYALQLAFPRFFASDTYLSYRTKEGGVWGAWQKWTAGDSDKLGGVAASGYLATSGGTLTGTLDVNDHVTAARLLALNSGRNGVNLGIEPRGLSTMPNLITNPSGEFGHEGWNLVSGTLPSPTYELEGAWIFQTAFLMEVESDVIQGYRNNWYSFSIDMHHQTGLLDYRIEGFFDQACTQPDSNSPYVDWTRAPSMATASVSFQVSNDSSPGSTRYLRVRLRTNATSLTRYRNVTLVNDAYPAFPTSAGSTTQLKFLYDRVSDHDHDSYLPLTGGTLTGSLAIDTTGQKLTFGNRVQDLINLYSTTYGFGIASGTLVAYSGDYVSFREGGYSGTERIRFDLNASPSITVGGTEVSLTGHTHSGYLATSGGTLTGALTLNVSPLTIKGNTEEAELVINVDDTGGEEEGRIRLMRRGTERWRIYKDSQMEVGSNKGSNFRISALNDAGSFIESDAMYIHRASVGASLGRGLGTRGNGASNAWWVVGWGNSISQSTYDYAVITFPGGATSSFSMVISFARSSSTVPARYHVAGGFSSTTVTADYFAIGEWSQLQDSGQFRLQCGSNASSQPVLVIGGDDAAISGGSVVITDFQVYNASSAHQLFEYFTPTVTYTNSVAGYSLSDADREDICVTSEMPRTSDKANLTPTYWRTRTGNFTLSLDQTDQAPFGSLAVPGSTRYFKFETLIAVEVAGSTVAWGLEFSFGDSGASTNASIATQSWSNSSINPSTPGAGVMNFSANFGTSSARFTESNTTRYKWLHVTGIMRSTGTSLTPYIRFTATPDGISPRVLAGSWIVLQQLATSSLYSAGTWT